MPVHIVRIGVLIFLITACMFLPFLPGKYDGLAVPLSTMAQIFAVVGLLLVPIGALWLICDRLKKGNTHYFAIAALVGLAIVAAAVSLGAAISLGISAGIITAAASLYGLSRIVMRVKRWKSERDASFNFIPLYLIAVPVVVAAFQFSILPHAIDSSRAHAIQNSSHLINEIEQYHQVNGRYPSSLLALLSDFDPEVIGIERYHYSLNGEAYNLSFEQLSNRFGTREIVIYNRLDEHFFPSHDTHILTSAPESLYLARGHYAVNDASSQHWKYFWFD